MKVIKLNSDVFSETLAVLQHRHVPLKKLFEYEFHFFPPSISDYGLLNPSKSAIVDELVTPCHNAPDDPQEFDPTATVIIGGERLVQQFQPKANMTFEQYARMIVNECIVPYFTFSMRIDIVFDNFLQGSLKAALRQRRGRGPHRRVESQTKCPGNWQQYLKDAESKNELFQFLAREFTTSFPTGRQLFVTLQQQVITNCITPMEDSDHEDADSRMLLHVAHALSQGMNRVKILTVDSDLVVIALGAYYTLNSKYHFDDINIEFGMKQTHRSISLKTLAISLGQRRCQALPFFHAFTGSQTTSAFKSIGKKKALGILKASEDLEIAFADIYCNPFPDLTEADSKFAVIQRFVILMYSKSSILSCVNEARMELYFQRSAHNIETIPPTSNSLLFHTKRAIYQCGIYSRCLISKQNLPSPANFGWKEVNGTTVKWEPLWMTQSQAIRECREFYRCNCKQPCTRCKCKMAQLNCTLLCSCNCDKKDSYD